jgi:xanthine dehydrogenase accessory factor
MRDPEAEIAEAGPGSLILVMTHDHPLDMAITAAALKRNFPYVGLIGSATKRARFEKRFRELALSEEKIRSLVCPIGLPGIVDKDPAIIAASVTAQLLQVREKAQLEQNLSPPVPSSDK